MFRKLHEPEVNSATITITINGVPVVAEAGETIAAILLRQPEAWCRKTAISGAKRGPYCMMGVCFDCLAEVDGVPSVQTCLAPVRDGMRVVRQSGIRKIGA